MPKRLEINQEQKIFVDSIIKMVSTIKELTEKKQALVRRLNNKGLVDQEAKDKYQKQITELDKETTRLRNVIYGKIVWRMHFFEAPQVMEENNGSN
jgi:hypothetical protein